MNILYSHSQTVAFPLNKYRIVLDVVFDSVHCPEQTLWERLLERPLAQRLVLFDRGFVNYGMFARINPAGDECYWFCRAGRNLSCDVLQEFCRGDALVRLKVPNKAREADPPLPRALTARLITYTIDGKGPFQRELLGLASLSPKSAPLTQDLKYRLGVKDGQRPGERIVGGNPHGKVQEPPKPFAPLLGEESHATEGLETTQYRTECEEQDVDQQILAAIASARVLDRFEKHEQLTRT